jgi:hypothetical protein
MRTLKFAIGVSVVVHVVAIGFFATRKPSTPSSEVVIEFAPSPLLAVIPTPEPELDAVDNPVATKTASNAALVTDRKTPPAKDSALEALLAMDLSSLRASTVRSGQVVDGEPIKTAGFGPVEPTIHLTGSEVDSLVSKGHEFGEQDRKRGVHTDNRQPTICIPPK